MFIYLHITQVEFVGAVLGTQMVVAASFLVIVSACLLLLLAIFGLVIAAVHKVKPYAVVCCCNKTFLTFLSNILKSFNYSQTFIYGKWCKMRPSVQLMTND